MMERIEVVVKVVKGKARGAEEAVAAVTLQRHVHFFFDLPHTPL